MESRLSEPQTRIYDFIVEFLRREGWPPTNREIGQAVGIRSTGHIDHHLNALETKGYIIRMHGKSRGIRLTNAPATGVRVIGAIAAGVPLDYYPDTEVETIDLNERITGHAYMLEVKGDSMIDDHIASGDFVLVDSGAHIGDGDIVVATHVDAVTDGGAATLKRFYQEHGHVRLQPANSTMDPIIIDAKEWDREWKVQGKVIAVYRRC